MCDCRRCKKYDEEIAKIDLAATKKLIKNMVHCTWCGRIIATFTGRLKIRKDTKLICAECSKPVRADIPEFLRGFMGMKSK